MSGIGVLYRRAQRVATSPDSYPERRKQKGLVIESRTGRWFGELLQGSCTEQVRIAW